ncbi:MAG TPA: DUF2012 domain-containing protein [Ignavibacteria bacterium]
MLKKILFFLAFIRLIATTYSQVIISGKISDSNNSGINMVKVYFISDRLDSVYTNSNGEYSFTAIQGKTYTIKPFKSTPTTEKRFFLPEQIVVSNIYNSINNINFTGYIFYRILCTIRDEKNETIQNINVRLTGNKNDEKLTTINGQVVFDTLARGTYIVQPLSFIYQFTPEKYSFNDLTNDQIKYFTAKKLPTYNISGYVKDSYNNPIQNATINLEGLLQKSTSTDENGYYFFTDIISGDYQISISKASYFFQENSKSVKVISSSINNINFTGLKFYKISGYTYNDKNEILKNVKLEITGTKNGNTFSNLYGYYSFDTIYSSPFTIKPLLYSYKFVPELITIDNISSDTTNLNFWGTKLNLFSISGKVVDKNGSPLKNVKVTLNGNNYFETLTQSDGTFNFSDVEKNQYKISFVLDYYKFDLNDYLINVDSNITNLNVIGIRFFQLGGYIFDKNKNPLQNIKVILTNSNINEETSSDKNGKYVFDSLETNNYTISITHNRSISEPNTYTINNLNKNILNNNFTLKNIFRISGFIKDYSGAPLKNITITISTEKQLQTKSDDSGKFVIDSLIESNASIIPFSDGVFFSPNQINLKIEKDIDSLMFYAYLSISGKTLSSKAIPVNNIKIKLSGKMNDSCITTNDGSFVFNYLPFGKYSILPLGNNLKFIPTTYIYDTLFKSRFEQNITVINGNSISGYIKGIRDNPINNIKIILSNSDSVFTDNNGYYCFNDIVNGTYEVIPQNQSYVFYPNKFSVTVNNEVISNQLFLAKKIIDISGNVTDVKKAPLINVKIIDKYDTSIIAYTDSNGNYILKQLQSGNFHLKALKKGFYYNPDEIILTNLDSSIYKIDFVGYLKLSGYIFTPQKEPIKNVKVILNGDLQNETLTNEYGHYEFSNLNKGNYEITFCKEGYDFKTKRINYKYIESSIENDTIVAKKLPSVLVKIQDKKKRDITDIILLITGDTTLIINSNESIKTYFRNGKFKITPLKTGYKFIPENEEIKFIDDEDKEISFFGFFGLEGIVTDSTGNGKEGIELKLNGDISLTSTTDKNGHFLFDTLCAGSYIIIPSNSNYKFSPERYILQNIDKSLNNLKFIVSQNFLTSINSSHDNLTNKLNIYPNPFNSMTRIKFSLEKESIITLSIYDILGRKTSELINNQTLLAGNYEYYLESNKTKLSSGIYFCLLEITNKNYTKFLLQKIILIK